tara:strand:+ start:103 stop:1290 length:1188 start_codon:yes stop_codon:yes gene_type:complete
MPDYSVSQLSPKLRQQIASNPEQEFSMVMNDLREAANSQHRNFSNSKINAEVISGFRTGESTGEGTDSTDARQISIDGEVYLEILVYTESGKGKTLGHPADPSLTTQQREIVLSCLEWARSDAPIGSISTPPNCGDRVSCYYETGAVQNSDFSGLRFRTDSIARQNSSTLTIRTSGNSPMSNLFTGQVTPLGATQSPAKIAAMTAADTVAKALKYDADSTIPNKSAHLSRFATDTHPEFILYAKAVIYDMWSTKQATITLNSTFRTVGTQRIMRKKWDDWKAGTGTNPNYAARPAKAGHSKHNLGTAIDFNATIGTKTYGSRNFGTTKQEWVDSGLPDIIRSHGLRWGGDWSSNYDPIHMDLEVTEAKRKEIVRASGTLTSKTSAIAAISAISLK